MVLLDEDGVDGELDVPFAVMRFPRCADPDSWTLTSAPTDSEWRAQLAGQTRLTVSARDALNVVREAWRAAVETPNDQREEGTSPL